MSSQNRVRILAELENKVSNGLSGIRDDFDRLGKSQGAQTLLKGVGLGIGMSAWSMLGDAVGAVTDTIGNSLAAAKEEESAFARLNTSLQANIPGFDGNTDAIKRLTAAGVDLGFTQSEQADSMARLVAATHDVTKAEQIQQTAMDLARFRKISLSDATDALTKVEAGSYRILKSLGIVLKDNATQEDALIAVRDAAMGQAKEYATTQAGVEDVLNAHREQTEASLGKHLAPIAKGWDDLQVAVLGFIDRGVGGLELIGQRVWGTVPAMDALYHSTGRVKDDIAGIPYNAHAAAAGLGEVTAAAKPAARSVDELAAAIEDHLYGSATRLGRKQELVDQIVELQKKLKETHNRGDATIIKGQIAGLRGELMQLDLEIALAKGPAALRKQLDEWKTKFKTSDKAAYDLTLQLEAMYTAAGKLPAVKVVVTGAYGGGGTTGLIKRASGGRVVPGGAYHIGEDSDEALFMDPAGGGGTVVPLGNRKASRGSAEAGVPVEIPIYLDGRVIARVVNEHLYYTLRSSAPTRRRS